MIDRHTLRIFHSDEADDRMTQARTQTHREHISRENTHTEHIYRAYRVNRSGYTPVLYPREGTR